MIRPDLSKWEYKEDVKGLLVFAQALDEMLFHHTIDTYKSTALGVTTNILELRYLAAQSKNNLKFIKTLEPVIEELDSRLKNDLIIKPRYQNIYVHYIDRIKKIKSRPDDLITLLNIILSELEGFYWVELLNLIQEKVADPKLKNDIVLLANTFIVEAELRGFSRSYIYYQNKNFFFRADTKPEKIEKVEQIKDFLAFFTNESFEWKIVFKGFSEYTQINKYVQDFNTEQVSITIGDDGKVDLPADILKNGYFSEKKTKYPLLISVDINKDVGVKDPATARETAKNGLDTLFDIYSFVAHKEQPQIFEKALVLNKNTNEVHFLQPPPNPMVCGIQVGTAENSEKEVKLFIDIVNSKHFDDRSSRLFVQSLDYHQAALEAKTLENQLIDMWAALEGFLPSPSGEDARIVHFKDALIPSLVLTYPEKILNYIALSVYRSGEKSIEIVKGVEVGDNYFQKLIALIVCEELAEKRKELYSELDHHPLLCNRIYKTHLAFKSKKSIRDILTLHEERVSWHIQRIYTSRNQIVHNANALPYLRTLVENLHSYLDILIEATSVIALRSPRRINIPSALEILRLRKQIYMQGLEGDDIVCSLENYGTLVFGSENPVSPFNGVSFFEGNFS